MGMNNVIGSLFRWWHVTGPMSAVRGTQQGVFGVGWVFPSLSLSKADPAPLAGVDETVG